MEIQAVKETRTTTKISVLNQKVLQNLNSRLKTRKKEDETRFDNENMNNYGSALKKLLYLSYIWLWFYFKKAWID